MNALIPILSHSYNPGVRLSKQRVNTRIVLYILFTVHFTNKDLQPSLLCLSRSFCEVNIKDIDGYKMPESESEFHMVSESESQDEETDIEFETESRDSESRGSESSDEDDI